jgi:hypothetical protein
MQPISNETLMANAWRAYDGRLTAQQDLLDALFAAIIEIYPPN